MPLTFSFNGTDVKVVAKLNSIVDKIGPVLVEKMTFLMTKLQQKARANTRVTSVKESIRDPKAEIIGTSVVGHLTWGGEPTTVAYKGGKPYDLALIFEEGTSQHAINPLTRAGTRAHILGAKRRIGVDVLHFYVGGKEVFAKYAFPRGIPAEHFMENAVAEMKEEFARGLEDTIRGSVRKLF